MMFARSVKTPAELRPAAPRNARSTRRPSARPLRPGKRARPGAISTSPMPARWPSSAASCAIRAAWCGAIRAAPMPTIMLSTGFEDSEVEPGTHVMFDCHGTIDLYCWDGGKTWVVDGEPEGDAKRWAKATTAVARDAGGRHEARARASASCRRWRAPPTARPACPIPTGAVDLLPRPRPVAHGDSS